MSASKSRKVIVATNIAETSLTIDGVDCVIDSGYAKVLRYDFSRAVNTLLVERISMASAQQRAGRAGRTKCGEVVRLWRQAEERSFEKFSSSEISRIDLSQIILWLKAGGIDLEKLELFEKPSEKSLDSALQTLSLLGAISADANITSQGKAMARFPTSPRMAKLFVEANKRGCLQEASMVAAVAEVGRIKLDLTDERKEIERASLIEAKSQVEEVVSLCYLAKANSFSKDFCTEFGIHAVNARKVFTLAYDFFRLAQRNNATEVKCSDLFALAKCILSAYPDRVCVRLNQGTLACRIVGGNSCEVRKTSKRYATDIFVAMSLQEMNSSAGVSLIADDIVPITTEQLREIFPCDFSERKLAKLDEYQKRACLSEEICYRNLPLSKKISYDIPEDAAAELLYSKIENGEIVLKNFGDSEKDFIERVNFFSTAMPELSIPPIDTSALADIFKQMCIGLFTYSEVRNADVMSALHDWLSAEQLSAMKYYLPKTVEISSRKKPIKIRYETSTMRAIISASFKDLFAFNSKSISICDGKIKPTFEILAPNSRPVQTTQDLETFWKTSWQNVRKELKARYPKHFPPTAPY